MLYQRYFLRMNQSNTTHILVLLLALILALSSAHIVFKTMQVKRAIETAATNFAHIDINDTISGPSPGNINNSSTYYPELYMPQQDHRYYIRPERDKQVVGEVVETAAAAAVVDFDATSGIQRMEIPYQLPTKSKKDVVTQTKSEVVGYIPPAEEAKYVKHLVIYDANDSANSGPKPKNTVSKGDGVGASDNVGDVVDENIGEFKKSAKNIASPHSQPQPHRQRQPYIYSQEAESSLASQLFKRRKRKYLNRHLHKHRSR